VFILSRRVHQEIVLGNGISITVVAIRGKQVRLGIKAPPDVSIRRDELAPLPDRLTVPGKGETVAR
jgi:carbon storage regulator